ncbi:hypothetical protein AO382_0654 [Moraxella catarrhalis]|uniref:Uncharacterized protein n=1 Tax=Moraxella catarrhalis TaxID=480 RepID=A0A7Z0UZG1_MORCA|nr:hypothetical protein AO382_0654 [Moraxella catarrhalis]
MYNQCSIKINLNDWFCLHLDIIIYHLSFIALIALIILDACAGD